MSPRNRDAEIVISVSDDGLEARGQLLPAQGAGRPLSRDQVAGILTAAGVTEGVEWSAIETGLDLLRESSNEIDIVLARGTPAEDADPPFLKLAARFFTVRLYGREVGGRVDFREARPFIVVAENEALGRYQPPKKGIPGRTVGGESIPPGVKERIPFEPGENTRVDGDYIRSAIAGRFILEGKRFSVREVLELAGVDFHTGNIRFPGDVLLRGEIGDGFSLVCGGDLHAAVALDVTEVQVKGDLTVEGGILGRRPGILKCGGSVQAKFLENCILECRGGVKIQGAILQSRVYSLGPTVCGDKGRIINSQVYAVAGVEARQLGSSAGMATLISAGSDFRSLRRLSKIRERQHRLQLKLETLESLAGTNTLAPETIPRLKNLICTTTRELDELHLSAEEALRTIEGDPAAQIVSRDTVYPGVTLEIAQVRLRVGSSIPRGVFYLDSETRQIRNKES